MLFPILRCRTFYVKLQAFVTSIKYRETLDTPLGHSVSMCLMHTGRPPMTMPTSSGMISLMHLQQVYIAMHLLQIVRTL